VRRRLASEGVGVTINGLSQSNLDAAAADIGSVPPVDVVTIAPANNIFR